MFQTRKQAKTILLTALALATSALASCGPPPATTNTAGPPKQTTVKAISVSEINPEGAISSNVSLSWTELPAETSSLSVYRFRTSDGAGSATRISNFPYQRVLTLKDRDTNLAPGTEYKYTLRGFNTNDINVVSGESNAVSIINASSIRAFAFTKPAKENEILIDATSSGYEFKWEDAGTGLYHIQVTDTSGKVLWGAITKNTTITYGTPSGTEKISGVTSKPDSKLVVPLALTDKLTISSPTPDSARNEVKYQGIQGGQYRVKINALETLPNKADLASAQSIAIRTAREIGFVAQ